MAQETSSISWTQACYSLGYKIVNRNIFFLCFLTFLGLVYIYNGKNAEQKIREISSLKSTVKDLNWEYMSIKSSLTKSSKYSSIENELAKNDLRLDGRKPSIAIFSNK